MAIKRLKMGEEMSHIHYGKPLLITYSGGKDSDACVRLAQIAEVPFEVCHSLTTVDAPPTIYHVREKFAELEEQGIKCEIIKPRYKSNPVTMWSLIPQKSMPPTRLIRYCCSVLKETAGANRMIVTGVRWAESVARANRSEAFQSMASDPTKRILANDNDAERQLFEACAAKQKSTTNPIIDWSDRDVWDFLHDERIKVNPLYSCGFNRVGCIGCPMARKEGRQTEFAMFPTYQKAYIQAFGKMLKVRREEHKQTQWKTGEDVFHWWMEDGVMPGQMEIEDMEK